MDLNKLDEICIRIKEAFGIPSLSAAFYVEGEYHNCSLGCSEDTLFAIGSCTKSFSAGTIMALQDDGLLSADDKLKKHIKDFKLSDPELEENVSIKDMLSHRSGLPGCDMAWYCRHDSFSNDDLMKAVSLLPKTAELGEMHQYNNMVFALSGKVIEDCAKTNWEKAIESKIIEPLGIKKYAFSSEEAKHVGPVAVPYVKSIGGIKEVPHAFTNAIGPAGSIYTTASELLKWDIALMHMGEFNGKQIISSEAVSQMEAALIPDEPGLDIPQLNESMKERYYGLGLQMGTFLGEKLIYHGGAIDGFLANQSFMPSRNCAAVMLTNLSSTLAREAFMHSVNGLYLGDDTDWISIFAAAQEVYNQILESNLIEPACEAINKPDENILGFYSNPLFGKLEVFFENSGYKVRIGSFLMTAQFENDVFSFRHVEFGLLEAEVIKNSEGAITSLLITADPTISNKFEFIKTERP